MTLDHRIKAIEPEGVLAVDLATVRAINPQRDNDIGITIGDEIVAVDGKPASSIFEFFGLLREGSILTIRSNDGHTIDVPYDEILGGEGEEWRTATLAAGETLITEWQIPATGVTAGAGWIVATEIGGLISASYVETKPGFLELFIEIGGKPECSSCEFTNIAVLDYGRNSWLSPVAPELVAWTLYPSSGSAPPQVSVPPPTPIGSTTLGSAQGSFNASTYGNQTTGSWSGTGVATTTQMYDYTAQNIALAQNLASVIAANRIATDTQARRDFVTKRIGNLRFGVLRPGERVTGYAHFAVPLGFTGPFLVVVQSGNETRFVTFEPE